MRALTTFAVLVSTSVACLDDPAEPPPTATSLAAAAPSWSWHRTPVAGDVVHYQVTVPIGAEPNAALRLHRVVRERAPGVARRTAQVAVLLHGDFSTFVTNFLPTAGTPASPAPGLARYLAEAGFDVWGLDRRWALPGPTDDVSDFAQVGVAQMVDDTLLALTAIRAVRTVEGNRAARLPLVGFSHGGQLAYLVASVDAARPAWARQVRAVAALDFYGAIDPAQPDLRQFFCDNAAFTDEVLAAGVTDFPNDFFIDLGALAAAAPSAPSPYLPDLDNRGALAVVLGQTFLFAPFSPWYHLLAPTVDAQGEVTGYAAVDEAAASAWLAGATAHQAARESGDFDRLLCGEGAMPIDAPLARIQIPVLYLGAAGGAGELGVYTTTQVSSTDVTAIVARRHPPGEEVQDVGHGDLLFAADAEALAWEPLRAWLVAR
jgi:hypothetical protein